MTSANPNVGRRTNFLQREKRLTEIYRLVTLGMPSEDIRNSKDIDVSEPQYKRDIKAIRHRIVTEEINKRREAFLYDKHICIDQLLHDKRMNLRIIQDQNTPVETRQKAIEFDASLNTTILKIQYEGSLYLRAIDNRNENTRYLQQQAASVRQAQLERRPESTEAVFE
jgi:hypothetical protein